MTVRIRLASASPAAIADTEAALRRVLDIPESGSRNYEDHGDGTGLRRYLTSHGVLAPPGGGRSPLAAAEDAKRARDPGSEISALMGAEKDLLGQPWMPLRAGDVVLSFLPGIGSIPDYGTTYVAVDDEVDEAGCRLRVVSHSRPGPDGEAPGVPACESFYDLWFESSPDDVVVIRGGAIVYGRGASRFGG